MGDRVRAARLARGWGRSQLARKAGVTPSYLGRLEKGVYKRPSVEKLRAIAGALGRTVLDLTDGEPSVNTDLLEAIRALVGTDEELWREIVAEISRFEPDRRPGALRYTLDSLQSARANLVRLT